MRCPAVPRSAHSIELAVQMHRCCLAWRSTCLQQGWVHRAGHLSFMVLQNELQDLLPRIPVWHWHSELRPKSAHT